MSVWRAWKVRETCVLLLALMTIGCQSAQLSDEALSEADRAAIRSVDSAYVAGWLANDSGAVLATLDSGVVLMPAGSRPLVGVDAARGFWWPRDGSRTTITGYTATVDELDGTPALAYVRGTSTLDFTYERDTLRTSGVSRTMTLTLLRKSADGRWRITRRMWGPLAN
ncbi:MAG TPA: DUF4440 domain-containing protein [Gemmatimonadaceae bacterium]|nr:DUF4440 domain-containing protein [Gemmatimonadaceae bacterium]